MDEKTQLSMLTCKHCKKLLRAKSTKRAMRYDKLFCNSSCRAAYSRYVARMSMLSHKVGALLYELGKYLDSPDTSNEASEYFAATVKMVKFEAHNRGIRIEGVK